MRTAKKKPKEAAKHLAECVVFALKFLKTHGLMVDASGKIRPWQEDFMDALDDYGYKVDREEYWKRKGSR